MKPLVYRKARRRVERAPRIKLHVTKGDRVRVMSGEFKGKEGKVLRVFPDRGRVVVDGVNVVKKHKRATQEVEGGIISFPAPIHASKVMLLDPKTGAPTRVRRQKDKDGTVERISRTSGQPIPRTR